jgi:Domain of unknown function (DUF1707)
MAGDPMKAGSWLASGPSGMGWCPAIAVAGTARTTASATHEHACALPLTAGKLAGRHGGGKGDRWTAFDRIAGTTIGREVNALLVSDREREYTVSLLRGHWISGRLTAEEFEERVAEAWRARDAADLWHALRSLPVDRPAPAPPVRTGSAVASVVLGALGLCILTLSFGLLFIVSLPLSVTAWALGREARRSGASPAGEVLGVIGTVAATLLFAGCAFVLVG